MLISVPLIYHDEIKTSHLSEKSEIDESIPPVVTESVIEDEVPERLTTINEKKLDIHKVFPIAAFIQLNEVEGYPSLEKIAIEAVTPVEKQKDDDLFAQEDLSVIRASLEKPTTESRSKVPMRAQWHPSTSPTYEVHVSNYELKVKLNEKQE